MVCYALCSLVLSCGNSDDEYIGCLVIISMPVDIIVHIFLQNLSTVMVASYLRKLLGITVRLDHQRVYNHFLWVSFFYEHCLYLSPRFNSVSIH